MSDEDFRRLRELIYRECGITLKEAKKVMLEARLRKRLRELCMQSFAEYCEYVFSPKGIQQEVFLMLNEVATNKTDFFREPKHFEYLMHNALPELVGDNVTGISRDLMVWSAGCSTGEEPYSIAMALSEFKEQQRNFKFSILATDISTKALEKAIRAVYEEDRAVVIPLHLKKKYIMRSRDRNRKLVRIAPELRAKVRFRRLNFIEGDFDMREPIDIIFCRNVIIYFDKANQKRLLGRLCSHLRPGGYLFTGHSETLMGFNVPLIAVTSTVYRKIK